MVSPEQLGEQYLTVYHRMHAVVARLRAAAGRLSGSYGGPHSGISYVSA